MVNAKLFFTLLLSLSWLSLLAEGENTAVIHSGVAWFDQNRNEVNAHGACIVKEGNLYYLFGEYKSDTSNVFTGFGCYSSPDMVNWKFERVVLPVQEGGILGPKRVGERVKVMKCPLTGEFVMYMHCDDMKYNDPHVGYATSAAIDGDYQFQGDILYEGKYLRKWDLGTYQDTDGKGYLLTHEGFIYELSPDYKSVQRVVVSNVAKGGESPALFKSAGRYFWLFSNKTSWERNDNYYLTATSLEGPWTYKGNFAPVGSLTWNSQCSFVLPVVSGGDTLFMYMGDRWSFPRQGSAATYVWQPITIHGDRISIPVFNEGWRLDKDYAWLPVNMSMRSVKNGIRRQGRWEIGNHVFTSRTKGARVSFPFTGRQVAVRAMSTPTSGYAKVIIKNSRGEDVISTVVDLYSKNAYSSLKFLSPEMGLASYTVSIEVEGEYPSWSDKRKAHYGSTDSYVIIEDVLFR